MKISWHEIINTLCGTYVEQLVKGLDKAEGLTCEIRKIIHCYLLELDYEYHGKADFEARVEKFLKVPNQGMAHSRRQGRRIMTT